MADSRRLALDKWRAEKQRKTQKAASNSHLARRVATHRPAPLKTPAVRVQRKSEPPSTPIASRRVSHEPVSSLVSIRELGASQEQEFYATVKTPASKTESSNANTTGDSEDDVLTAKQRRKRRRSYISPGSNVPSFAGGAQRVLTPTRLLQQESDDGGMDGDLDAATPEIVAGPRRVSVLATRRERESDTERQTMKERESLRKTVSLGNAGVALRVPSTSVREESSANSDVSEEQVKTETETNEVNPVEDAKGELKQPLPVRVFSPSSGEDAKPTVTSPQLEKELIFSEGVRVDSVEQAATAVDIKATRKSISNRRSLDDSKVEQLLSERLQGNPKWGMDDFAVTKSLGQGKFGNVYLAKEKCSNATVALKVLFKAPLTRDGGFSNLKREVEIQVRLHHPNVLSMYGYFYDDSCVYLVLEYAPYGELYKELAREKFFADEVATLYVVQVVEALKYCHSCHVIHRDIKPENLLLGYNQTIKLADFGWSVHAMKPYNIRRTFCGTPDYLSPEMILGEPYDFRTDLWSLGVLTYELLIGSTPFYCENKMDMYKRIQAADYQFPPNPPISETAKSFIAGLLKQNPEDRMSLEDAAIHPWILNGQSN